MTKKYCLVLYDSILFGVKCVHKKSGLYGYSPYICNCSDNTEKLLFDTEQQAKIWLLSMSSFPSFKKYIWTDISEERLNFLYLKGEYTLSRVSFAKSYKLEKLPLLCEIIISECDG